MNPKQKRGGIEEYRHLRQAGGGRAEGAWQEGAEAGRGCCGDHAAAANEVTG